MRRRRPSSSPPPGIRATVVSMPSWDRFASPDASYQDDVLPAGVPVLSVEAGVDVRLGALRRRIDRHRPLRRQRTRRLWCWTSWDQCRPTSSAARHARLAQGQQG